MPHYKDGAEAQVGDKVFGRPYNREFDIAGEIVQITPGSETCNCIVAFTETKVISDEIADFARAFGAVRVLRRAKGGIVRVPDEAALPQPQEYVLLTPHYDYGETSAFVKVG